MKTYMIISATFETEQNTKIIAFWTKAAQYGNYFLINGDYENQFSEEHPKVEDKSMFNIVPTADDKLEPTDLTEEEFLAWATARMQQEHDGTLLLINRQCAKILRRTIFKTEE